MAKELDLKAILNKNIDEHKADIKLIAKRSLPHAKSRENSDLNIASKWQSSNINDPSSAKSRSNKKISKSLTVNPVEDFSEKMFLFSLGADRVIDKSDLSRPKKWPLKLRSLDVDCRVNEMIYDRSMGRDESSVVDDDSRKDFGRSAERFSFASPRYPSRDPLQSDRRPRENELLPHYIHPRYQTRYREMVRFRVENVRESDQMATNMLQGSHLVEHLEEKLAMVHI